MNYKKLLFIFIIISSCADVNSIYKNNELNKINNFSNYGFALIFDENLYKEKIVNKTIDDRELVIFQKNLKKGVIVKVSNPSNQKTIIATVGKDALYPIFNNSVISQRIAAELELNIDEPYVKIEEVIHNISFVAKKAKTYEIEKKVANKAPVDEITINNLSNNNTIIKKKDKSYKFNYYIKIADFYFMNSATLLKDRILNESALKKINILEISQNKFRVILGPYLNLKSLQKDYNIVHKLNFENLEIVKHD